MTIAYLITIIQSPDNKRHARFYKTNYEDLRSQIIIDENQLIESQSNYSSHRNKQVCLKYPMNGLRRPEQSDNYALMFVSLFLLPNGHSHRRDELRNRRKRFA